MKVKKEKQQIKELNEMSKMREPSGWAAAAQDPTMTT